ncbi:type IV pilus twitching motility protein PilT [Aquifex aeolicus]|uniref:Twitching mobility protein n=1 Tax=Aquifex aeolicus (strain VF5) TaxID=224324 RepID=O67906_AQUAE|nr:type IV pilus twitching motility protein PilT [Aquifex aeolicus]AAC07864.1 twitching mobility protein [Aquifex aeolicus VF5]
MLDQILRKALEKKASDIHLKVGSKPVIRTPDGLDTLEEFPPIDIDLFEVFVKEILEHHPKKKKELEEQGQVDLSYAIPKVSRFRVNLYKQRGTYAMALRVIPFDIPEFKKLNLPPVMLQTALKHSAGMILVTGPTGSGKSTTIASIINEINKRLSRVIITIEDPIEYLFKDIQSFIAQREVGWDTESFFLGLRAALREDPDIIFVGEIRDTETAKTALHAAETGHLVFSTLHTLDAVETINRFIGMFPLEHRDQIRQMLASTLIAVYSQRLVSKKNGGGKVPVVEIMIMTQTIREAILENRPQDIPELIEKGRLVYGSQTFDQHLEELYRKGLIDLETALLYARRPADLELRLKGISTDEDIIEGDNYLT